MSRRQAVATKPPAPAAASHRAELLRGMTTIRLFEERCVELYSAGSIRGFLHVAIGEEAVAVGVMQTREALTRVATECGEDLADDGVVYAEVRYAPEQHVSGGLSLEQVVEAVRDGFAEGEEQARAAGTPVVVRQLLTAMRHQARSQEIAELMVRYRDEGVVGFDIAGAEAGYPPTRHLAAYAGIFAVATVALAVQVYSVGYLDGDDRYAPYAAQVSLFTAAMRAMEELPRMRSTHPGGFVLSCDPLGEYLMKDPAAWKEQLTGIDADFVCVGHTHVQFHLELGATQVINPGSVGQPRDQNPQAAYAILDVETNMWEARRVPYDIAAVQKRMREYDLPERLVTRLEHGW